jgi:predicted nuclease of restriction endonuclease-like RecB superfamily
LQLALAFPAIAACGRWTLEADLRWGKDRRPLRFVQRGESAEVSGQDAQEVHPDLPPEVAALLADLAAQPERFTARPATALLPLPGAGVIAPDIELVDNESGRGVFVEVLGFWSRDAVWKRIELAQKGLPAPVVFAVSKHLRVSEAALPSEIPAALYVYAHKLSARAVIDRARSLLDGWTARVTEKI